MRYLKIDPEAKGEMHLGHQYEKDGSRSIDKRCDYCGKWMVFDCKNYLDWGTNVKIAFNGVPEKVHCGSAHCCDYHHRVIIHQEKLKRELAERHERLFFSLKGKGLVS